ncbi:MAG: outer membrane beta-barrel domain-containing protein [Bacteriovoracaceae bacterium]|jgi:outer membrane beta-barrel protein|nr:outer membrane beta-barrel domain-containing protein [Bacteriovoracaceae bacterium]
MFKLLLGLLLLSSAGVFAVEKDKSVEKWSSLDEQLDRLKMPANQIPGAVSKDKFYSVQLRYVPLLKAHEVSLNGSKDFNAEGHINSNQLGVDYRYHFNDKWTLKVSYLKAFNELNKSGRILLENEKLVSDSDYLMSKADIGAEYNLFYGKFRLGTDSVFYFDQYIGLTAGMIELRRGASVVGGIDAGFAFWMGKRGSLRIGVHNNFYEDTNGVGEKAMTRNMIGYLSLGLLMGGE